MGPALTWTLPPRPPLLSVPLTPRASPVSFWRQTSLSFQSSPKIPPNKAHLRNSANRLEQFDQSRTRKLRNPWCELDPCAKLIENSFNSLLCCIALRSVGSSGGAFVAGTVISCVDGGRQASVRSTGCCCKICLNSKVCKLQSARISHFFSFLVYIFGCR